MNEKQEYIQRLYNLARLHGLCSNQNEMCRLLAMNATTLSKALQGDERFLTDNFMRRVRTWAKQAGLEDEMEGRTRQEPEERAVPSDILEIYNKMAETIRLQAEVINRLQKSLGNIAASEADT